MTPLDSPLRATMAGGPEGLEITIPAGRNLFAQVFLAVWLVGWCAGEMAALAELFGSGTVPRNGLLFLWLAFWTLGGAFAAYTWLWMLVGKERILLGTSALRVKRDVLGMGRTRTYELLRIRNLRVASPAVASRNPRVVFQPWGLMGGSIVFDYEGKPVRFGAAIHEAEARMIVERMKARFVFPEMPAASP